MEEISNIELKKINGGISVWAAIAFGSVVAFLVGVYDGLVRPIKCHR